MHWESEEARWARYAPAGLPDECWVWRGSVTRKGYGLFTHQGKRMSANRASLLRAGVELGRNQLACHHCDNPPCVNPAHLYAGSPKDNALDASRRGGFARRPAGEAHHRTKLPDAQVLELRERYSQGESSPKLGRAFGISQPYALLLAKGLYRKTA